MGEYEGLKHVFLIEASGPRLVNGVVHLVIAEVENETDLLQTIIERNQR